VAIACRGADPRKQTAGPPTLKVPINEVAVIEIEAPVLPAY